MRVTLIHPAGFNFVPGQPEFTVLANRMAAGGQLPVRSRLDRAAPAVRCCPSVHAR